MDRRQRSLFWRPGLLALMARWRNRAIIRRKFPDPVDYFYQARGFTLAEAYYQSLLNPFEGLFLG